MSVEQIELLKTVIFSLHGVQDTDCTIMAQIRINYGGKALEQNSGGNGPIDALFHAVAGILYKQGIVPADSLTLYMLKISSIGQQSSAMGEATVQIGIKDSSGECLMTQQATATHSDINYAGVIAIIHAINALLQRQQK